MHGHILLEIWMVPLLQRSLQNIFFDSNINIKFLKGQFLSQFLHPASPRPKQLYLFCWGPALTTIRINRKANWFERLWIKHLRSQPSLLQSPENLSLASVSAGWNTWALAQHVFEFTHNLLHNLFHYKPFIRLSTCQIGNKSVVVARLRKRVAFRTAFLLPTAMIFERKISKFILSTIFVTIEN